MKCHRDSEVFAGRVCGAIPNPRDSSAPDGEATLKTIEVRTHCTMRVISTALCIILNLGAYETLLYRRELCVHIVSAK